MSVLIDYNLEIDEAENEIESGNFVSQKDVENLLSERRKSL